ncbi:conserved Plasmodium protein, unknown function [Plasmodium chabaudi adami]|uniref:Tyrosine-protein kinase ephrin type A/B receptor-like domain-containing protein n=1 Tax=Plasmodium chabaudi adami TaxID=5826 RepID=A0A1C6YJU6_PLACE|nr:conserved Plasmodium protein, unknown function [Plasmodium chabaudi adami]
MVCVMYVFLMYTVGWGFTFVSTGLNLCNYGEYIKNNKCYECEENKYSNFKNAESCFSCPPSSYNNKRSSKYIHSCSCDSNYYLNYIGNRCDKCSDIASYFFCENNLNELYVDNVEYFLKHTNEINFKNYDRCSTKKDRKNIYPFMNNIFIYCKNPGVCLDTCGKCSENNEGFICNNCKENYYKNIYLKYSTCKKCYHIITSIIIIIFYCFIFLIFLMILFKYINISLYFYHLNIYKKETIYFLHYFREFMFYLSLIFLISFSNDLTENEQDNSISYEHPNKKQKAYPKYDDLESVHYLLNIYLHNLFFDIIKVIHLNFLNYVNIDCLYFLKTNSKLHTIEIFVFIFFVVLFGCLTLLCNFIFLYLRKSVNKYARNVGTNLIKLSSSLECCSEREDIDSVKSSNENKNKNNKKRDVKQFKKILLYPFLFPNFCHYTFVNVTFFYDNDVVEFFKNCVQIYYYQYVHIIMYMSSCFIMFIFLSGYICIGIFNYNISYYDTETLCYDNIHLRVTKYMGILIISIFCFIYYIIVFISILRTPYILREEYKYKYIYGFYTFLCKKNKYYYYIFRTIFINLLFLMNMQLPNNLSCLIYMSFLFILLICITMFLDPHITIKEYNIKLESFFFMFLFFFNIQLEQIRIVTYNMVLRVSLSILTLVIYSFILLYYLFYMLRDVYIYFSLYKYYIKNKSSIVEKNKKCCKYLEYYIYYYLKKRVDINMSNIDSDEKKDADDLCRDNVDEDSLLENCDDPRTNSLSKKDIKYIYYKCVFISPFIPETIIQLLFIVKNINHVIHLRKNKSNDEIYNFIFENGYIEIQKTSIDRFLSKAKYIFINKFQGNYKLFKETMMRMFSKLVRSIKCYKDLYIRECVAEQIKKKYKINEIDKNVVVYDENYEQSHINTFLYKLRGLNENVCRKNKQFSLLFPSIDNVILKTKKNIQKKKYAIIKE